MAITVRIATKGRARCICNYRAGKLLWNYTISQQFFPSPFKKSSTDSMPVISLRRYVENTPPPPPSLTSQSIGLVKITGILLHVIITLIIVLNIFFPPGVARFPTFFFFSFFLYVTQIHRSTIFLTPLQLFHVRPHQFSSKVPFLQQEEIYRDIPIPVFKMSILSSTPRTSSRPWLG